MRRRKDKIDANQPDIVKELRKLGLSVEVGHDDILVGYNGKTCWYEIKDPEEVISKKTGMMLESCLKDSQKRLRKEFKGHYRIVTHVWQICLDFDIIYRATP